MLRNYTVRAYREDGLSGPELDVDFVLHGDAASGTAGPAAGWADRCEPGDAVGIALVEVGATDDIQNLDGPSGVDARFIVRPDVQATPGGAVLAAAQALPALGERCFAWTVGESALVAGARRHWIATGVPKDNIMFCGYWKAPHH